MIHVPFSTKLKTCFDTKPHKTRVSHSPDTTTQPRIFRLSLALIILTLLSGCASSGPVERRYPPREQVSEVSDYDKRDFGVRAAQAPLAPWEINDSRFESTEMTEADRYAGQGHLIEALRAYEAAELATISTPVKEEAFYRRMSTMLKLGKSKEALDLISARISNQGRTIEQMDSRLALIAAFAYEHSQTFDQTIAWLGLSYRRSGGMGEVAYRASGEATRLVKRIPEAGFEDLAQKWTTDQFISRVFSEERMRRSSGGKPVESVATNYFNPDTYSVSGMRSDKVHESDLSTPISTQTQGSQLGSPMTGGIVIGALLPLSGKYAEHAERVRRGIELGFAEAVQGGRVRLIFSDEGADPTAAAAEYERLARVEHAALVLGPLLVNTTEAVAARSREVGVPILSFTKKRGIPELAPTVFRLGATADNQTEELVSYTNSQLGIKSYSIFYPANSAGEEFVESFRRAVQIGGGEIKRVVSYRELDPNSIAKGLSALEEAPAQAVFVPDTLERAWPAIQALQNSSLKSATLIGPATWDDPTALRGFGRLLEGAVFVTPFNIQSPKPTVGQFITAYRSKYASEPDLLSAQAYDASKIVLNVLGTGDNSPSSLINKLRMTDSMNGVTGKLSVNPSRDIIRRMSVMKVTNGEVVEVMSGGMQTGFISNDEKIQENRFEESSPQGKSFSSGLPPARTPS